MDTEAVKRVLLADMALQNGAAGRDLTMATKRFRQAVFKTTFKKNKHMVSSVAPLAKPPSRCFTARLLLLVKAHETGLLTVCTCASSTPTCLVIGQRSGGRCQKATGSVVSSPC